jgi:Uma2 family endonuclease
MTPDEYLRWESYQDERFEYEDGEIVALAGAKNNHERIVGLLLALGPGIRASGCDFYHGDTNVSLPAAYTTPTSS